MLNGLYSNFIKNNSTLLNNNNIDVLKKINISNTHNINLGLKETVSIHAYLSHLITLPFLSDEKKSTLKDILEIPKKNRYIAWANKHIPKPEDLTSNQISRITTAVQESFHLAKTISMAFSQKIPHFEEKYCSENKKIIQVEEFHENSFALSGGAIRDILFLPETNLKDLDFCFAFTKTNFINKSLVSHIHPLTIFSLMEQGHISKEHQDDPEYSQQLQQIKEKIDNIKNAEKIKLHLSNFEFAFFVRHQIAKHGNRTDIIFAGLTDDVLYNDMGWEEYINYNLSATVKTLGQTGIPIDILVSATNNDRLIKSFDFCLCKSSLNLNPILDTFKEMPTEQECIEYFYNNLFVPITVLRDINAKELSISEEYVSQPEKMDFFVNKHYKRLLQKYHNFDLNIEGSIGGYQAFEQLQIIKNKLNIQNILLKDDLVESDLNEEFKI